MTIKAMLTAIEAAEYVGCTSVSQFRREVKSGIWPEPFVKNSRPQRWSRAFLEKRLIPPDDSIEADQSVLEMDKALGLV